MKKLIILFLLPLITRAQDSLVFKNDSVRLAQILLVDPENIKFKLADNTDGPERVVHKSQVKYIRYKNGKKDNIDSAYRAMTLGHDLLVMKNEAPKAVVVKEISDESIKYKSGDNPDGPLYVVHKSQVNYIRYSNGTKENIDSLYRNRSPQRVIESQPESSVSGGRDMFSKGVADAKTYYIHKGGSVGVGVTTFFFSIIGLIPAIIVSATPPKEKNLGYPRYEYWKNRDYQSGYKSTAKKIKQRRVWTGFGIGLVGSIIANALLQS